MKQVIQKIHKYLNAFWHDRSGVTAIVFALTVPVIVASVGMAVDLAQAYNVKNRLSNALDKAALAAASSTGDEAYLNDMMQGFFEANFPDAKLGTPYDVTLTVNDNVISISAMARVDMSVMNILGYDYIDVSAETEVIRELSGVEVALVLDVTGSMAGSNISALKQASTDFLNIMFDRIEDDRFIKIGIVPYSNSVNVGAYGLGQNMDGSYYGRAFVDHPDTDDFISPASNIDYDTGSHNQWHGCIEERDYPLDTTDDTMPNWEMYRYPEQCSYYRWGYCYSWRRDPNYSCPTSRIIPLTNNQAQLQGAIDGLSTGGNTYGNVGMVWGWRVISPEEPFTEGVAYTDDRWTKTVIMMTDGDNTMHPFYSVYGRTSSHSIRAGDLDDRLEETCENMKAAGVRVYTITFQSGINDTTRGYYRRCASDESMYYDAPSNEDLVEAFQQIADQLSQLHISK